jgi:CHAD domain-containing protein
VGETPPRQPAGRRRYITIRALERESLQALNSNPNGRQRKAGLTFWMERVLEECDRAAGDFASDPVHDLRVALRRCRSMADGLRAVDPDPAWKQMKKAGKALFSRLGDLRDVQVMEEWVHHFDSPGDSVTSKLLEFLAQRETQLKQEAAKALPEFDRKQWRKWSRTLPRRTARLRPGNVIFKHLALERWTEAYHLHRRALRNRSQTAFHQLRIGLKRLRYIVENFLPEQHEAWGNDLKKLQDLLGEVHDLDVLWTTALQIDAFPTPEDRARWHEKILQARTERIEKYRAKMLGPSALWHEWRAQLPQGEQIQAVAWQRLKLWASFLDPDTKHTNLVSRLALQLYDGLARSNGRGSALGPTPRQILRLAALLHDVGRAKGEKRHHKETYRLLQKLTPPLGIGATTLHTAGAVARYHRGALPRGGQAPLRELPQSEKREAMQLAGILRLANALDSAHDSSIRRLRVDDPSLITANGNGARRLPKREIALVISAEGYKPGSPIARTVAAERYLLETVSRRPILLRSMPVKQKLTRPRV